MESKSLSICAVWFTGYTVPGTLHQVPGTSTPGTRVSEFQEFDFSFFLRLAFF